MSMQDQLAKKVLHVLASEQRALNELYSARAQLKECEPASPYLALIETDLSFRPMELESALRRLAPHSDLSQQAEQNAGLKEATALLESLYGRFEHAALAAASLHAVAHRAFESSGDGNLADLAEAHYFAFSSAATAIAEVISAVAVWELEQAGEECICRCPSCAIGICLCARHGKETVAAVRLKTAERPREEGIAIRQPRTGSPAALAGLQPGDILISAAGRAISGPAELQSAVREQPSDADIPVTVRRGGTTNNILLRRV